MIWAPSISEQELYKLIKKIPHLSRISVSVTWVVAEYGPAQPDTVAHQPHLSPLPGLAELGAVLVVAQQRGQGRGAQLGGGRVSWKISLL